MIGEGYNEGKEVIPVYPAETPTQVQFPLKAVLRTVVAYVVGLGLTWAATQIPDVAEQLRHLEAPVVEATTNGIAVAIAGFTTWLMTRPKVNAFLVRIGLGAKPKYAA